MRAVRCWPLLTFTLLTFGAAGCGVEIAGSPEPAAGFVPPANEPAVSVTSSAAPVPEARIPHPRLTVGVDPCTLLTPEDLAAVGGPAGPPHPGQPRADTCTHTLGGGPENAAAAGFDVPFPEAVERQPEGTATVIEGHSTWLYCERQDAHQTCAAVVAVRAERSLLTLLSLHEATAADTAEALHTLTGAALEKLPPG